jgi:hypothetical protein
VLGESVLREVEEQIPEGTRKPFRAPRIVFEEVTHPDVGDFLVVGAKRLPCGGLGRIDHDPTLAPKKNPARPKACGAFSA